MAENKFEEVDNVLSLINATSAHQGFSIRGASVQAGPGRRSVLMLDSKDRSIIIYVREIKSNAP